MTVIFILKTNYSTQEKIEELVLKVKERTASTMDTIDGDK